MSGDELHDQSRKITTEGGEYREGGQQQSQRIDVRVEGQKRVSPGLIAERLSALGNGGLNLEDYLRLKQEYPEHSEMIGDVLLIQAVKSIHGIGDCVWWKTVKLVIVTTAGMIATSIIISIIVTLIILSTRGL